jgi:hypothetical protein
MLRRRGVLRRFRSAAGRSGWLELKLLAAAIWLGVGGNFPCRPTEPAIPPA